MNDYEPIPTVLRPNDRFDAPKLYYAEVAGQEANCVLHLIDRWGMVAAVPDGEDSAGRQKLRLMTPEELTTRAMQTAEVAFRTLRAHGWIAPSIELTEAPAEVRKQA